jgi:chemotaxis protein CheX
MEEQQLKALVESVIKYFEINPLGDVSVGSPYLVETDESEKGEHLSGTIGISGSKHGWLRYSAPKIMIKHLLLSMGETDTSDANVADLIGEVANTISGNLRKEFGAEFIISIPKVETKLEVSGEDKERRYVVPIYWKQYNSSVVIYLG